MKKSTMGLVIGGAGLAVAASGLAITAYKNRSSQEEEHIDMTHPENKSVLEDSDFTNSEKIDQVESVDADVDPEEEGLSQYDAALRAEWVANGEQLQTHLPPEEIEQLENQKK